jgi:GNAT superfamily N-acetyltransferase
MSLAIRPMRADDLERCAALYERVVRATFTWLDVGDPAEDFRLAALEEEVLLAEVDGVLAGLAAFYRPECFLHSIYVEAAFQGQGVGRALMRRVEAGSPEPITLKVQVLNLNARRFYARDGFGVVEEGGDPLPGNNRWLRLDRAAPEGAQSPEPWLDIRPATPSELDLCAALYERQAARLFTWEPADVRTAHSKRITFEGQTVIVALEHDVLAGFAVFDAGARFVDSLFVEPQGAGTGPALLAAVSERLGPGGFTLDCDERNAAGLRFYAKTGFVPVGREIRHGFAMIRLHSHGVGV